jgi:hypothetical protein
MLRKKVCKPFNAVLISFSDRRHGSNVWHADQFPTLQPKQSGSQLSSRGYRPISYDLSYGRIDLHWYGFFSPHLSPPELFMSHKRDVSQDVFTEKGVASC